MRGCPLWRELQEAAVRVLSEKLKGLDCEIQYDDVLHTNSHGSVTLCSIRKSNVWWSVTLDRIGKIHTGGKSFNSLEELVAGWDEVVAARLQTLAKTVRAKSPDNLERLKREGAKLLQDLLDAGNVSLSAGRSAGGIITAASVLPWIKLKGLKAAVKILPINMNLKKPEQFVLIVTCRGRGPVWSPYFKHCSPRAFRATLKKVLEEQAKTIEDPQDIWRPK